VLGTPSDRVLILDDKTIFTYFFGGLPYLDEWKKNKCSQQDEEGKCENAIDRQNRMAAYEKYFHVKPSDTANYNFSRWSSATNYLGRNYYELMSEERFEDESGPLDLSFLHRSATANAPSINLADSPPDRARVVTSVDLNSPPPNPSQEFTQKLVATLEAAWGKRSGGDGSSKWQWISDKFMANLENERSPVGHYLHLHIEARR
jgi:hypothetical protein